VRSQQQASSALSVQHGTQFVPRNFKLRGGARVAELIQPRELQQNIQAADEGARRSGYVNSIACPAQSPPLFPVAYSPTETRNLGSPGGRVARGNQPSCRPHVRVCYHRTPGAHWRSLAAASSGMRDSTQSTAPPPPVHAPRRPAELSLRPLWQAASFAVLLYVAWMLLAGLFQPRLEWIAGTAFAPRLLLYYLCLDAFALALSAAYLCLLDGGSFSALGLSFDCKWLRQAILGIAWGSGVISVTALLLFLSRAVTLPSIPFRSSPHLALLTVFLLLAATFEELTFRGYALQRLAQVLGPVAAAALSSALFGLAHYGNPQATLLSTFNTVLAGVLLAAARLRSRALWMPIGLHFGWNLFLGPVYSFPVSGYTFGVRGLAASTAVPQWLTGGAYGPEGSAPLTAVLLAAILLLLRLPISGSSLRSQSAVD
jgi:CAAX protease family protein